MADFVSSEDKTGLIQVLLLEPTLSKEKTEKANNVPADKEDTAINNTEAVEVSLKETYLEKLNNAEKEVEELEPADSTTLSLKEVENERYGIWDDLLNEIYGELKVQLPAGEMDQLKEEQLSWITYRDNSAHESSLKFEGASWEPVEYASVLANLTQERCHELVENYMK
ncbi:hypothetical protein CUC15_05705 [Oceanobacillus zhaokaii]|uniref:Lysozyme inhibitor LprI-like N-terminal domain-containing protein n=2 Tax=Oceanobacillus zhaokaii TaxID=2052660 RepID=A0A345PM75_9BACI|nr:hypothetical protein CUC15_05705 [Oceanobacillus zhaokaii]